MKKLLLALLFLGVMLGFANATNDLALGKSCSANNSFTGQVCDSAFDNDNTTKWYSSQNSGRPKDWNNIVVDLNDTYTYNISQITVFTYPNAFLYYLQIWSSDDNSTWTSRYLNGTMYGIKNYTSIPINSGNGITARYLGSFGRNSVRKSDSYANAHPNTYSNTHADPDSSSAV